jgi:hypothetical protein
VFYFGGKLENNPCYGSTFDGNQGPDSAYVAFVRWLNRKDVHCEYLLIMPISWKKEYNKVLQLREDLENSFGVLLLEDIFDAM